MKLHIYIALIIFSNFTQVDDRLKDAPLEWLISATVQSKISDHDHDHDHLSDTLLKEIFESVKYDTNNDDLILSSNKKTYELRSKLISYLSQQAQNSKAD